jgi:hypothetical protein
MAIVNKTDAIRIGTKVVAPPATAKAPATPISPVPASQPKTELYQAVNGSVWRWNASVNQWQMVQAKPSVQTPFAPQLVGTITKPIPGQPGASVTVPNTANPNAPGEVFLPGQAAPIIIPAGPAPSIPTPVSSPTVVVNSNPPPEPQNNVSYNYSAAPTPTSNPFFTPPVAPVGVEPVVPPQAPEPSYFIPILIIVAFGALMLSRGNDE